jgi:hypothetical protein
LFDYAGEVAIDATGNLCTIGMIEQDVGNQDILWSKKLGASSWDEGVSISVDESGYVFITGFFQKP